MVTPLATEEYHNELYEELKLVNGATITIKLFDHDYFDTVKGETKNSPWIGHANELQGIHSLETKFIINRKMIKLLTMI
ncbi:MAG: hypothetical protein ABIO55_10415 [Ginsengibacter sp.]